MQSFGGTVEYHRKLVINSEYRLSFFELIAQSSQTENSLATSEGITEKKKRQQALYPIISYPILSI